MRESPLAGRSWLRRRAAVLFLLVWFAAALILGGLFIWQMRSGSYAAPLDKYLEHLVAGDARSAYEMTCARHRAAVTLPQFVERADRQFAVIGTVTDVLPLQGENDVGYRILKGSQNEVETRIPMRHEDNSWKPCPAREPLGEVYSPS
jgi:hypothetical protein